MVCEQKLGKSDLLAAVDTLASCSTVEPRLSEPRIPN